jgi:hypothetical protein
VAQLPPTAIDAGFVPAYEDARDVDLHARLKFLCIIKAAGMLMNI